MKVELLFNTPLWVASTAIRKCWASEDKSDTEFKSVHTGQETKGCSYNKYGKSNSYYEMGEADKELIYRVGNKNKHASTLEHLNYSFDIDGISRACLQELARHRHASMSVKSTRYTLKELMDVDNTDRYDDYLVMTDDPNVNAYNKSQLHVVRNVLLSGVSNDKVKFLLPEAYKTSLVWTVNARSLQNFLALRTNKAALWEIQDLAHELFKQLPDEHKYLFEEFVEDKK